VKIEDLVDIIKLRWRIERDYEELNGSSLFHEQQGIDFA
jgi:SRSO17 transposase